MFVEEIPFKKTETLDTPIDDKTIERKINKKKLHRLIAENKQTELNIDNLKKDSVCSICFEELPLVQLAHANGTSHKCVCSKCANTLKTNNKNCPICREPIVVIISKIC